jgi:hypothetical protein
VVDGAIVSMASAPRSTRVDDLFIYFSEQQNVRFSLDLPQSSQVISTRPFRIPFFTVNHSDWSPEDSAGPSIVVVVFTSCWDVHVTMSPPREPPHIDLCSLAIRHYTLACQDLPKSGPKCRRRGSNHRLDFFGGFLLAADTLVHTYEYFTYLIPDSACHQPKETTESDQSSRLP